MPEWRKELSERVREVQEKRAREAAREAAEVERQRVEAAVNPPQLELLPPAQVPAMNPLVAAALKRIERAHQTTPSESHESRTSLATAVAYAPEREENDMSDSVPSTPQLAFEELEIPEPLPEVIVEKPHHLSVVTVTETIEPKIETPKAPPKRLIKDDDPALNYLDSISGNLYVDDLEKRSASAFRRLVGAMVDLIFCAMLTAPIAGAMYLTGTTNLEDPRVIGVLAGSLVVVTFLYLTLMTALTGRTWAMRLLKLRVIDTKTGLIPTGGQSIGRSIFYLMSLGTVIGILFALVSREGYTIHDRFTRTAVVPT